MGLYSGIPGGLKSQGAPVLGSNSRLVIFDENKAQSAGPSEPRLEAWVAPPTSRAKENEQKLERWCDVKVWENRLIVVCVESHYAKLIHNFLFMSS